MKELTAKQKKILRAWVKEYKRASFVWINSEGAVNYTTENGSFFFGWDYDLFDQIGGGKLR